jgi:hypothetical protein
MTSPFQLAMKHFPMTLPILLAMKQLPEHPPQTMWSWDWKEAGANEQTCGLRFSNITKTPTYLLQGVFQPCWVAFCSHPKI